MNLNEYSSELAARLAVRQLFVFGFVISLITNLVLGAGLILSENQDRIVVLPAEPTKSFWLDDKTVSPEYLEQMGTFVVQLALNNSPETFEHNITQILKYVEPAFRGDTELALLEQARKLKNDNASTSFLPESVDVQPKAMKVAIHGHVRKFIGNVLVSTTPHCLTAQFNYHSSRLWLHSMAETDCKKPFETAHKNSDGATS
ncbi:MAG: type IV conjugative transfer system protein TraE [Burkholderiales bacterium]|nr:type IV conjugative transfer system protein TraE [Burkholderiales bacterium]